MLDDKFIRLHKINCISKKLTRKIGLSDVICLKLQQVIVFNLSTINYAENQFFIYWHYKVKVLFINLFKNTLECSLRELSYSNIKI